VGGIETVAGINQTSGDRDSLMNQCDGCRRGLPLDYYKQTHYDHESGLPVMGCTKHLYETGVSSPEKAIIDPANPLWHVFWSWI
jgi:hypothetical protein